MKKNTMLLLGAAAIAVYFLAMRRRRGSVTVQDAEIISEREFVTAKPTVQESPLEKVTNIVSSIFPKRSAEQKQAAKAARVARRAGRKAARATKKAVAGFSDNVLY